MEAFSLKKTLASLPRTERGKPIVINGDPKGKNFLYCNGNNVFIRNINDTSECDTYSEHSKDTTVAKYSPSGFYIASGDITGKVRVWDTVNAEHILKNEICALGGVVKDLDWTMDSGKLIIVGEGREEFGRAVTFDTGNSCGEIRGHSKSINSVAVKQSRPMRAVTASEDYLSCFFEGPPFKFSKTNDTHTNFVNCVRYNPDGSKFITGGSDGKLFMFDGKTSDPLGELGEPKAHKGGIYAICFNGDGSKLLSVSGDKSARIWNMENNSMESEFVIGKDLLDMQVGCLWQGDNIISVSLSGYLNWLDPASPQQPKKIIKGHNKPIMALAISSDGSRFYSGSSDGLIVSWDAVTSENDDFKGKGHTNQVMGLAIDGDNLVSIGIDDTIRFTNASSLQYGGDSVKLDSQPQCVDCRDGVVVVVCLKQATVFQAGKKLSSVNLNAEGLSVSIRPCGTQVAVGTRAGLYVYSLSNGVLGSSTYEKSEPVHAVQYSPDGAWLGMSAKESCRMYHVEDWKEQIGNWGKQHQARVTSLAWAPDSRRFVSGGVDSHIVLWEQGQTQGRKPSIKAHPLSHINKLGWLDNNTVITAGQDSNIKLWNVKD